MYEIENKQEKRQKSKKNRLPVFCYEVESTSRSRKLDGIYSYFSSVTMGCDRRCTFMLWNIYIGFCRFFGLITALGKDRVQSIA